jgi:hypothetical protein
MLAEFFAQEYKTSTPTIALKPLQRWQGFGRRQRVAAFQGWKS